ncbi:tRNA pseudouridine(38-40) synthase TruA [Paraphotobacterium marinum]|uniref:tRNA pseudouridine synthase A n=1 Tax=Paraphotobacterium marinum TaxID=1755811 RepID=A0A220VC42_9GAMM|nr:tRNA pseudouridine(38-40) synthase TruA [Paraphotobacterium marinum]ASK77742.1 tRNA pseudouridine(38-40) synthase TruA [Paraphotobacterium marinum]
MRYALGIEYDGSTFCGFQKQKHCRSVQEDLEQAISLIGNEKIEVFCAGRTDTGVHATFQVIHFDSTYSRSARSWSLGVNSHLSPHCSVKWAQIVPDNFHARFSALNRSYAYIIYNGELRPSIWNKGFTHVHEKLDETKMHDASQLLLGENDFSSFRASSCQSNSSFRNIQKISVKRQGEYVIINITANAFLHHMVRNIVGSLIDVGKGLQKIEWFNSLLRVKDRNKAGVTAKPNGLYLVGVEYPEEFGISSELIIPLGFS